MSKKQKNFFESTPIIIVLVVGLILYYRPFSGTQKEGTPTNRTPTENSRRTYTLAAKTYHKPTPTQYSDWAKETVFGTLFTVGGLEFIACKNQTTAKWGVWTGRAGAIAGIGLLIFGGRLMCCGFEKTVNSIPEKITNYMKSIFLSKKDKANIGEETIKAGIWRIILGAILLMLSFPIVIKSM